LHRLLAALLLFGASAVQATGECRSDQVRLRGDWGETLFNIELADTPQERSRGLMFREFMARNAGMLFVYDQPQRASFWMKNTLISLDMLFVDQNGSVTRIHHQAEPGNLAPLEGGDAVYAVLEINGGLARQYGISVGTVLQHEIFSGGDADWPC